MKTASGRSERDIFLEALDHTALAERDAFVAQACAGDDALRKRVEELLEEAGSGANFLDRPAVGPNGGGLSAMEREGGRIGPWKLLQQIGEGGCGVVYMAEQEAPVRRRVALKVIKLGMDTKSVIARFEAERQALAMMDHPNIARVLDAGATQGGRPYFVMELVRGAKITDYCDENQLSTEERLNLFVQVCGAIQHAHQKGIIHRDIKPSNILVTLHDATPVPKVIDFGIAKATEQRLTEKTLFTEFQAFIGTPAYMSPEQAGMSGLDIDTRSDIYSLGVLLYQLLTSLTPFDAEALAKAGIDECRRVIRESEPPPPSTRLSSLSQNDLTTQAGLRRTEAPRLLQHLRGDLDWIVMKCLEKDRARRYATAQELAADVRRHLNFEPVEARAPGSLYRLAKLVRRRRGAFMAGCGIAVSLLAGIATSTVLAIRATKAERNATAGAEREAGLRKQAERDRALAEAERAAARRNEYVADMNLAQQSLLSGNLGRARQLVEKHRPREGETDLRGFEWRYLWRLCQGDPHATLPLKSAHAGPVRISSSGGFLVVAAGENIVVWDWEKQVQAAALAGAGGEAIVHPAGRWMASASRSGVRIWDTRDWTEARRLPGAGGPLSLSADGARLLTGGWGGPALWNTEDWSRSPAAGSQFFRGKLLPAGNAFAGESQNGVFVQPVAGREEERTILENSRADDGFGLRFLAVSPDGKHIVLPGTEAAGQGGYAVGVWDAGSGARLRTIPTQPERAGAGGHASMISSAAFSPDGALLATGGWDHSVRLWDFRTGRHLATWQGHLNEVMAVAFSPDGRTVASGGKDGDVNLWPVKPKDRPASFRGEWRPAGFSSDGKFLAAVSEGGALGWLHPETGEVIRQTPLWEPDGKRAPRPELSANLDAAAWIGAGGTVQLWRAESGPAGELEAAGERFEFCALSKDGGKLAAWKRGGPPRIWDLKKNRSAVLNSEGERFIFSPDGRRLASAGRGSVIRFFDPETQAETGTITTESPVFFSATFSPDGNTFAAACFDNSIRLWDVQSGTLLGECIGHRQAPFSIAFSPDGKMLATSGDERALKLWSTETRQELLTIPYTGSTLVDLAFSPDGQMLAGYKESPSQERQELVLFFAPALDGAAGKAKGRPLEQGVLKSAESGSVY